MNNVPTSPPTMKKKCNLTMTCTVDPVDGATRETSNPNTFHSMIKVSKIPEVRIVHIRTDCSVDLKWTFMVSKVSLRTLVF